MPETAVETVRVAACTFTPSKGAPLPPLAAGLPAWSQSAHDAFVAYFISKGGVMWAPVEFLECDEPIRPVAKLLHQARVQVTAACSGGVAHQWTQPTIHFLGDDAEGERALNVLRAAGYWPRSIRRVWEFQDGGEQPRGPEWAIELVPTAEGLQATLEGWSTRREAQGFHSY